ncbi:hypothetical protein ACFTWH_09170 [Streptomyces sp. NPDC057011]
MPDRSGVTDPHLGILVDAFGAPQGVNVTEVRLKPQLAGPLS